MNMTGELTIIAPKLGGEVTIDGQLNGKMKIEGSLSGDISSGGSGIRPYEGDYQITPLVNSDQIFPTKNTRMTDDLTVYKTPTYEVTNPQGGMTLIIGDD